MYGSLRDKSEYVLSVICNIGNIIQTDEVLDETKRLCDVQPYFCILKIAEKTISTDNPLNKHISELIGKPLEDFKNLNIPEV